MTSQESPTPGDPEEQTTDEAGLEAALERQQRRAEVLSLAADTSEGLAPGDR